MSNVENILAKIDKDAKQKAGEMLADAKAQAAAEVAEKEAEANKAAQVILSGADEEAKRISERIQTADTLRRRDGLLAAKRSVINQVMDEALVQLRELPQNEYVSVLLGLLPKAVLLPEAEYELLVPPQYASLSVDEINGELAKRGVTARLRLGSRPAESGFILAKGGIEQNFTFTALLDYYRDELEAGVLERLYTGGR